MAHSNRYSPEVRERAVRMVFDQESEYGSVGGHALHRGQDRLFR